MSETPVSEAGLGEALWAVTCGQNWFCRNGRLCPGPLPAGTNGCPSLQGGPCGVLAAVQGCVLQKLLFEGASGADCTR